MKWEFLKKLLKRIISSLDKSSIMVAEIEHYIIRRRPLSAEGLKWKRRLKFAVGALLRLYIVCLIMTPLFFLLASEKTAEAEESVNADVWVYYTMIVPPTVTTDGGATNITETEARLRGEITDTGNENPDVWVFWGLADGGTDPGSWSNNASLGAKGLGIFYNDIDSLTQDTLYYYQVRATNSAGTDWADSSANFTTLTPGSTIEPPEGFTVMDLGAITVEFNWTKGYGANYTMIRGARDEYPASVTEGELIYYGPDESANSTGYALDVTEYKFSAWGYWSDNISYSTSYETASIGGAGMTGIADAINALTDKLGGFNILAVLGLLAPLVFFTWLTIKIDSDWGSPILAFITGGLAFFMGYNAPNIVDGKYETTTFGLALAVALVIYSLVCLIWAWSMMFKGRWWR